MVNPNDSTPLQTPVASKRKISAIGKGKATFITWKNALFAFLWLLFCAFIGFATFSAEMWVKGVVFACMAVPGLCFFLIPVPGKDYYWLYNYVIDSIKFAFARSANRIPNLGATSEFIPFTYIKENKLFFKGEGTVQIFWRLNGRNIFSCSEEIQKGLLNNYHDLLKNLHNSTIKLIGFKANFNLKDNFNYWKTIIKDADPKYINSSFIPISVLEWQNWQFARNFPFYKDRREKLTMNPAPRDMAYMIVISGDSEFVVEELSRMIMPNLRELDGDFVEPATSDDIKMYIGKQLGLTSVDLLNGFDKVKQENTDDDIEQFNELFTNMHSMTFKPRYWKTVDWRKVGTSPPNHYHRIFTINSFKTEAILGWMDPFFEDPAIDCIQIKVQEIPLEKQSKLIGKAINQYTKVEKGMQNVGSFQQSKLEDTFTFLRAIEAETNRFDVTLVKTTFYIKISSESLEGLNRKEIELKSSLKKFLGIEKKNYDALFFKQRDALLSSFGVLNDKLSPKIGINLLSSAVALGWPFNNPRVIQSHGFHIGFTANGLCPICLDIVGQRSLSGMIIGKTGSGKSLLAKLLSLNILLNQRNKIFWFDPENEMANFGYNLNGVHVDLTSQVPLENKIEFDELMSDFKHNNLLWDEERYLKAYMALLNLPPKSFKYMHGLSNKKIKELFNKGKEVEYKKQVTEYHLLNETMDYFGLGSLKKHSKLVSINNSQITPLMLRGQLKFFEPLVQYITGIEDVDDIWLVYQHAYEKCIKHSNINPYRIVLSSAEDLQNLNGIKLYQQHKQMLLTWFKQLCPKADIIGTTWFNTTLDELYHDWFKINTHLENGQYVINFTTKELVSFEKYPTIQDHYDIMYKDFKKMCATNGHPTNQTSDIEEKIRICNEILSVFDNLVMRNRNEQQGLFFYLWNKDTHLEFSDNQKLIIFNIQNLLTNVRNIKENNYTDQIKIDFQNIFNAQYYLSQQIIWSFVVNNRVDNAKNELPKDKQSHVFIFMDEAHASLKQPQFVDWSVNLIKRARKYQSGLWLITQSIGDYLKLDDAPELFNNFMFKFYFQSEAQAFDDILKKFKISRVPLTVQEERWLNPLLGNTTQGRCILTFEDGKRYMMTVSTSVNFIISILERNLMSNQEYKVYNPYTGMQDKFGPGVSGWINYLRDDPEYFRKSNMNSILQKAYKTWLDNNLRKYEPNEWEKQQLENQRINAEIKQQNKVKQKIAYQASLDKSKKEKRGK